MGLLSVNNVKSYVRYYGVCISVMVIPNGLGPIFYVHVQQVIPVDIIFLILWQKFRRNALIGALYHRVQFWDLHFLLNDCFRNLF